MAPACFIGVVCTGNIHHIRRHGFSCGKRRNTCPRKHTQAHEQRHEQGERLFQCFHLVTSLKWPQKKHIALDVLLTAGFVYVLKKRGAPESLPLIRPSTQPHTSVEKKPARAFYHLRLWIYLLF